MAKSAMERDLLGQRRILAEFGEQAVIGEDLDSILEAACKGAGEGLETYLAKFIQIDVEKRLMWVRSGVGWTAGVLGQGTLALEPDTPEWYSLSVEHPVISQSTALENRFSLHPFQIDNRVAAFVNVIVYAARDQRPIGIFEVDSRTPRAFTESDVDFLRNYASLIAACFERFRITGALKEAEAKLRESERRLRRAVELNPQIPWTADARGAVTSIDVRWGDFSGVEPEQTMGQGWRHFTHPDDMPMIISQWTASLGGLTPFDVQVRLQKKTGKYDWYQVRAYPELDEAGHCQQWYGTVEDISERVRLEAALRDWNDNLEARISERTRQLQEEQREREAAEAKLRQSQKMEAVGQLTGGIAHDFNNLLGSISASLELMQLRIAAGRAADIGKYQTLALTSVQRAAALTRRLLAFSRQQPLDPKVVDPNEVVAGLEDMIRRTMGPDVVVRCDLASVGCISCDINQLENALLNLAINARDAMAAGGTLTLRTQRLDIGERTDKDQDMQPGTYVLISVTDDGCGMSEEVLNRAFDPFFTTKKPGQGTGLGLSMIYGFTRQSGGQIRIKSALNAGTTVSMYFPLDTRNADKTLEAVANAASLPSDKGNGEVILVVDDETGLREIAIALLTDQGYAPHEAIDSASALKQFEKLDRLDLLITDIGLPGPVNGLALAKTLKEQRPQLKVLFITGYTKVEGITEGLTLGKVLSKPFSVVELSDYVRSALASEAAESENRR
ncbi:ATP-binding protein [Pseudomonas syringae]|uniref:ATP-binding protein n=1 Tax=Pseudomonas syringae TaxID=317 RepID=UPI000516C2B3|nr:ATP-binding protein [Pseudomonas syringae]